MTDAQHPSHSSVYAWFVVAVLALANAVSFIDRLILSLLVQPIKAELAISDTAFSLLAGAAFAIFYATMGLVIARWADRYSRKWIITTGIALWCSMTALAGTARSEDHDVFAADEKEIREHEYVAQTLVSKLLDLGQLSRHPRSILNLGSIVHFLTRISVKLHSPMPPEALIRKLHPTPALGPLPRTTETMNQLIDWRKRLDCPAQFGAPFGVLHNGRFEAIVAIRGIWFDGPHIRIPAGCGIIEASRLVNEWRELRLKRESVKNFLFQSRR